MLLKSGSSSIDVLFSARDSYTNKLHGRNIEQTAGKLKIDYSHYNARFSKKVSPETTDALKMQNNLDAIVRFQIKDGTVKNKIDWDKLSSIELTLPQNVKIYHVSSVNPEEGFIDVT